MLQSRPKEYILVGEQPLAAGGVVCGRGATSLTATVARVDTGHRRGAVRVGRRRRGAVRVGRRRARGALAIENGRWSRAERDGVNVHNMLALVDGPSVVDGEVGDNGVAAQSAGSGVVARPLWLGVHVLAMHPLLARGSNGKPPRQRALR